MLIDCDRCVVRGLACSGCVVSVLLGGPPEDVALAHGGAFAGEDAGDFSGDLAVEYGPTDPVHVDAVEVAALDALAAAGLVPPLRLVLPDTGTG